MVKPMFSSFGKIVATLVVLAVLLVVVAAGAV